MSDIAIRVEGLSKRYRIGQREPYKALPDVLTDVFAAPFRRLHENSKFEIRNVSPAAFCLLVFRNPPCLFPCSRALERSGAPLQPFRCLLPSGLSQFAIRNSQWNRSSHVSRFTLCGVIPHSTFRIPNLKGPCTSRY